MNQKYNFIIVIILILFFLIHRAFDMDIKQTELKHDHWSPS